MKNRISAVGRVQLGAIIQRRWEVVSDQNSKKEFRKKAEIKFK